MVDEINAALTRLGAQLEEDSAERWSNASGRTRQEVVDLLSDCAKDDMAVPSTATLRPWCDPSLIRTCRVPFVPVAAVVHAWSAVACSVAEIVDRFELEKSTNPWTMLDRVDAEIAFTDPPDGVTAHAEVFRAAMAAQHPEIHSPSAFLWWLLEHDPKATLETAVTIAQVSAGKA